MSPPVSLKLEIAFFSAQNDSGCAHPQVLRKPFGSDWSIVMGLEGGGGPNLRV